MPEVKKTKPSTKTTEIELGSLGQLLRGRGIARSDISTTGYPCLRYGEIYTTYDNFVECLKSCLSAQAATSAQSLETGDIVFAASGETADEIGKSIAYIGPMPAFAGSDTLILRDHGQDPVFLAHLLNSEDVRIQKARLGKGYSVVHIHAKEISKIRITLPPLSEQRKIARILRTWDEAVEMLEELRMAKEMARNSLLQNTLDNRNWPIVSIDRIGVISGAGVDKKIVNGEDPVRLLNFVDVMRRDFLFDVEFEHVVTASERKLDKCNVQKGDIFFTPSSEVRDDIAHSAVAMETMPGVAYSYHVIRLRPTIEVDLRFRSYLFKSEHFLKQAYSLAAGSGQRYVLSQDQFRNMTIRLPEWEVQQKIAAYFFAADREISLIRANVEALVRQKRGLMERLLTA